jgi:hypothetical protein
VAIAVLFGCVVAHVQNTDWLHLKLRRFGLTLQTSYSSEWYGALSQHRGYIVLHLVGQRRLFGWPEEWPSAPDQGHFVMRLSEWLDDKTRIPLTGVDKILIKASEVEMVELMSLVLDDETEVKDGRS